jgi:hypothetical protein
MPAPANEVQEDAGEEAAVLDSLPDSQLQNEQHEEQDTTQQLEDEHGDASKEEAEEPQHTRAVSMKRVAPFVAPAVPAFASTVRPAPAALSPFARPQSFPSEKWPTPPLADMEAGGPGGVARVQAQLDALPSGSRDRFARWVMGVASVVSYDGERSQSGMFHGQGTATFKGGARYTGSWNEGLMHGEGEYTWADGCVYRGTLAHQSVTGTGRIDWPDGAWYQGEVLDGQRHGQGTFIDPSVPCSYTGTWDRGLRHGAGKVCYALQPDTLEPSDSHFYEGQFERGARHGYGILRYASGNLYEGYWSWDRKVGQGTMHWYTRNQRYSGTWLNDQPHGQGEYTWLDLPTATTNTTAAAVGSGARGAASLGSASPSLSSSASTAAHQQQLQQQHAVTHFQQHNRYVGTWVQGVREGRGALFYSNGSVYDGSWQGNRKHGLGRFVFANGSEYRGEFRNDQMADEKKWNHPYTGVAEQMAALTIAADEQNHQVRPPSGPASPSSRSRGGGKKSSNKDPFASARDIGVFDLPLNDVLEAHAREQGFVSVSTGDGGGSMSANPAAAAYLAQQREQVANLLLRYNSELLDVYRYYSTASVEIAQPDFVAPVLPYTPLSPTSAPTSATNGVTAISPPSSASAARMNLAQLWLLVGDLGLVGHPSFAHVDLSLASVDRLVFRRMQLGDDLDAHAARLLHSSSGLPAGPGAGLSSLHDPRHVLLQRDFLEALVRLADELFRVPADAEEEEDEEEVTDDARSGAEVNELQEDDVDDVPPSVLFARAQANFNLIMSGGGAGPATTAATAGPTAGAIGASPTASALSLPLHALTSLQISSPSGPNCPVPSSSPNGGGVFSPGSTQALLSPAGGVQGARIAQFGATTGSLGFGSTLKSPVGAQAKQAAAKAKFDNTLAQRLQRFLLEIVLPRAKTRSKHLLPLLAAANQQQHVGSYGHHSAFSLGAGISGGGSFVSPRGPQPLYRLPALVALVKRFERDIYLHVFLPHSQERPAILPAAVPPPSADALAAPLPPLSDRSINLGTLLRVLQSARCGRARVLNSNFTLHHCLDVLFGPAGSPGRAASSAAEGRLHVGMHAELLFEELLDTLVRLALWRGRVLGELGASLRAEQEAVEAIKAERRRRVEEEARRVAAIEAAEAEAAAAAAAQAAADAEAKTPAGKAAAKAAAAAGVASTPKTATPQKGSVGGGSTPASKPASASAKKNAAGGKDKDSGAGAAPLDKNSKRASLSVKKGSADAKGKSPAPSPRTGSNKKKAAAASSSKSGSTKKGASVAASAAPGTPGSSSTRKHHHRPSSGSSSSSLLGGASPHSSRGSLPHLASSGGSFARRNHHTASDHLSISETVEGEGAGDAHGSTSSLLSRLSLADGGATGAWAVSDEHKAHLCADTEAFLLTLLGRPLPLENKSADSSAADGLLTSYPRELAEEAEFGSLTAETLHSAGN